MVFGGIFVLIGLFVVIPTFGPFGVLWTLMAAGITGVNAYQAFGKGYVGPEIHIEDEETPQTTFYPPVQPGQSGDAKARLEQLESLKTAGLLTEEEYQAKRAEILRSL